MSNIIFRFFSSNFELSHFNKSIEKTVLCFSLVVSIFSFSGYIHIAESSLLQTHTIELLDSKFHNSNLNVTNPFLVQSGIKPIGSLIDSKKDKFLWVILNYTKVEFTKFKSNNNFLLKFDLATSKFSHKTLQTYSDEEVFYWI